MFVCQFEQREVTTAFPSVLNQIIKTLEHNLVKSLE